MGPFRLAVLAGLLYLLYRLLTAGERTRRRQERQEGPSAVDDILVEDPVCHTYVPQNGAETCRRNGKTFYFCSKECRNKFESDQNPS